MNTELLEKLQNWFEEDEHRKIIEVLSKLEQDLDYDLIGHLGRAYNNDGQYEKAISTLLRVEEEGKKDALWNFRMGYAYFYDRDYEKALPFFVLSDELGDDVAATFVNMTNNNLADDNEQSQENDTYNDKYAAIVNSDEYISVCFYIENEKPFRIGEKLNELNQNAYMNGYNWEAFFNYYLAKNHKHIFQNLKTDPEAGMYVAYYETSKENEERAASLLEVITDLIDNENKLYEIIKKEGNLIEWD